MTADERGPNESVVTRRTRPVDLPGSVLDAPARLFFGGSFDPPHVAHTELPPTAAAALAQGVGVDPSQVPVVYIPAARSPHKDHAPASDEHRLAMLGLALEGVSHPYCVWTQELGDSALNPGDPSYWADTWAIVRAACPSGVNRFLIGTDQARSMHKWTRFREFWRDALVIRRDDGDVIADLRATGAWSEEELAHWAASLVENELIDAASSDLREAQKNTHALDERVRAYIEANGLY